MKTVCEYSIQFDGGGCNRGIRFRHAGSCGRLMSPRQVFSAPRGLVASKAVEEQAVARVEISLETDAEEGNTNRCQLEQGEEGRWFAAESEGSEHDGVPASSERPGYLGHDDIDLRHAENNIVGRKRSAWNKGLPVPDSVKMKLSASMKERWKDPEYRESVSAAMQGKPAWNKGKHLSMETREKMRQAKLNHTVSKETRQKMSEARKGKSLDPEAASLVSQKLKGVPKSEEHKENIASAMRKRHAAIRVLTAVESVYENTEAGARDSVAAVGKRQIYSAKKQATSQVLSEFKAELREYRALQDELSPWTQAFVNRHDRKPSMADVERTGISWLVTRYKRYVLLRERLFHQTSILRKKIGTEETTSALGAREGKTNASINKINANGPTVEELSQNVSRLQVAAQYKFQKALQEKSKESIHKNDNAASDEDLELHLSASTNAAPRVKEALKAAMEYRKTKAAETKSAAMAAAAAAQRKKF